MSAIVLGSIHMDMIVRSDRLPKPGETILGWEFKMLPGGKGANQAVALSKLNVRTGMVSRVGDDFLGRDLLDNLERNGVDTSHVKRDPETHTGLALIIVDKRGRNMIAVARGADEHVSVGDVEDAAGAIASSDYLLAQLELPIETVVHAIKLAHGKGTRVILNAAPAQRLPQEVFPKIDYLVVNEVEASLLSRVRVRDLRSAERAGRRLVKMGVGNVVITLGRMGAMLVKGDGEVVRARGIKVEAVDTTGAGDAFCGAFTAFLSEGRPVEEALQLANYAAALSITRVGAQEALPTRDEVLRFAGEQKFGGKM